MIETPIDMYFQVKAGGGRLTLNAPLFEATCAANAPIKGGWTRSPCRASIDCALQNVAAVTATDDVLRGLGAPV